eukprot:Gb_20231 [translate_table: standard]
MKYDFAIFLLIIAIPTTSASGDGVALFAFLGGLGYLRGSGYNSPCSWAGVFCNGSTVQLSRLTELTNLDLGSNSLSGSILFQLGRLKNLKYLGLSGNLNRLSGSIPFQLGRLKNLEYLGLSDNALNRSIPKDVLNLPKLQQLQLGNNSLEGIIPPELAKLSNLRGLDLHSNRLVGSIPTQIAELTNLMSQIQNVTNPVTSFWLALFEQRLGCSACVVVWYTFGFDDGLTCKSLRWKLTVEDLPQELVLKEIFEAVGDLTGDSVIGEGSHGIVFKLEMPSGKIYAVKKLTFGFMNTNFTLEVETLGSVRHRNLVKIVGFWACQTWGLIIYEYMSNGNLYQLLHEINPPPVLNWEVRYRIALGIAHGLAYLHHDSVPQIIPRDIKSTNILMNSDLEPHIADFCLAKPIHSAADKDLNSWYAVVGTLGYIAPENGYSTRVDEKSDVYSYGVVLLEVLTRKKAVDSRFEEGEEIVSWVKRRLEEHRRNPLDFRDDEMWDWTERERGRRRSNC